MTTVLTSTEIAQLTAAVKGEGGYKRAATKQAAINALAKQLTERGREQTLTAILNAESYEAARVIALNGTATEEPSTEPVSEPEQEPERHFNIEQHRDEAVPAPPPKAPVHANSNRAKVLDRLSATPGEWVTIPELVAAVYGESADAREKRAPLMMVLKGIQQVIDAGKLNAKLVKIRENKETKFALTK